LLPTSITDEVNSCTVTGKQTYPYSYKTDSANLNIHEAVVTGALWGTFKVLSDHNTSIRNGNEVSHG